MVMIDTDFNIIYGTLRACPDQYQTVVLAAICIGNRLLKFPR